MVACIREYQAEDAAQWDAYVKAHKEGSFFHLSPWKRIIEKGSGNHCRYILAEDEGKIVGVLPLTERSSLLFGKAYISNMFAVYGGALADNEAIRLQLEHEAWEKAQAAGISVFESRDAAEKPDDALAVVPPTSATFIKKLEGSAEDILLAIPRKQRAVIRKSLEKGLKCQWDKDLDRFFRLYAESVRNLGTPVFPKKLFKQMLLHFPDNIETQIIETAGGKPIASLLSFYYKDAVLPYYAGGTPEARQYGAHDFMYYQLMQRAVSRGCCIFDFGRSKIGSGPYKFKKNWGFEPTPLYYRTRVAEGEAAPDINPSSKKYERLVSLWKKLPLPVANILGPVISRHLG